MDQTPQEIKQAAIDLLASRMNESKEKQLADIDPRLLEYIRDVMYFSFADPDNPRDRHNVYEVLGAARFLRLLDTYSFNKSKVQTVIKLREGEWTEENGKWRHLSGGLKCPGTSGAQVYRWQPFQVFVLASVFGFMSWMNTKMPAGSKVQLLPTEREKDGMIWDYRRLCTDFTFFAPRKTDKTGLAAFIQVVFFFFEDNNAECYCAANASAQSALLFSRTRQLVQELNSSNRIRNTQTVIDWRNKSIRDSSVRPLTAGGKTKDGMFAQLCCADEFGSAPYTNGKSDMLSLVNVIQSSMGPRREPLTFITTTAGTITSGPFMEKLAALHNSLLRELTYEDGTGENTPDFESDRRLCLCLEPDEWETEEEVILTKKSLRHKVNPMLGYIVQHSSYDAWISEASADRTKMPELISKYFNHYITGKVDSWKVKAQDIMRCQTDKRVTDCKYADGWQTYVGLDFSSGEDLFAISYLSVNVNRDYPLKGHMFADMEAWITEDSLHKSPNRPLYEKWIAAGWLKVCPGKVFNPDLAIADLMEKDSQGINMVSFGFDPAQSRYPINTLKAWLLSIFLSRGVSNKDAADEISRMVVAVPQTFMNFTGPIDEIEWMIMNDEPWLEFSPNPMWAWETGNVKIVEVSDMRKILKSSPSAKVDNWHALINATHCMDLSEGRIK